MDKKKCIYVLQCWVSLTYQRSKFENYDSYCKRDWRADKCKKIIFVDKNILNSCNELRSDWNIVNSVMLIAWGATVLNSGILLSLISQGELPMVFHGDSYADYVFWLLCIRYLMKRLWHLIEPFCRPREESSKKKVPMAREVIPIKKNIIRDPRFDSSCGTLNEKVMH